MEIGDGEIRRCTERKNHAKSVIYALEESASKVSQHKDVKDLRKCYSRKSSVLKFLFERHVWGISSFTMYQRRMKEVRMIQQRYTVALYEGYWRKTYCQNRRSLRTTTRMHMWEAYCALIVELMSRASKIPSITTII